MDFLLYSPNLLETLAVHVDLDHSIVRIDSGVGGTSVTIDLSEFGVITKAVGRPTTLFGGSSSDDFVILLTFKDKRKTAISGYNGGCLIFDVPVNSINVMKRSGTNSLEQTLIVGEEYCGQYMKNAEKVKIDARLFTGEPAYNVNPFTCIGPIAGKTYIADSSGGCGLYNDEAEPNNFVRLYKGLPEEGITGNLVFECTDGYHVTEYTFNYGTGWEFTKFLLGDYVDDDTFDKIISMDRKGNGAFYERDGTQIKTFTSLEWYDENTMIYNGKRLIKIEGDSLIFTDEKVNEQSDDC